jgi:hypothetical protein
MIYYDLIFETTNLREQLLNRIYTYIMSVSKCVTLVGQNANNPKLF